MSKKLRITFISFSAFFAVIVAYITLGNYFSGVGLNLVALIALLAVCVAAYVGDTEVRSRTRDLLPVASVLLIGELIAFFFMEFGWGNASVKEGFWQYQIFLSVVAIFALVYTLARFILDANNIKVQFIEIILGNVQIEKPKKIKTKTNKELSNGSLEDKPNKTREDVLDGQETFDLDSAELAANTSAETKDTAAQNPAAASATNAPTATTSAAADNQTESTENNYSTALSAPANLSVGMTPTTTDPDHTEM